MSTYDNVRRFYARLATRVAGGTPEHARLEAAFAAVPRERFLGPGPWQIPIAGGYMSSETDDPAILYQDMNVALVPELRINNGQPTLHAACLGAAAPQPGETVVHVGAGSGYYTAILSELNGPDGQVHAFELNPELAERARVNLADRAAVAVHAVSAIGHPLPSADVIYVSAGATDIPAAWLDALAAGGRLVLPLTPDEGPGFMLMVTRIADDAYLARSLSPAYFIACAGARDPDQSRALAAAIAANPPDRIRSLRRHAAADGTAWCVWPGWWLSTAER